jgi:hypothetical protein
MSLYPLWPVWLFETCNDYITQRLKEKRGNAHPRVMHMQRLFESYGHPGTLWPSGVQLTYWHPALHLLTVAATILRSSTPFRLSLGMSANMRYTVLAEWENCVLEGWVPSWTANFLSKLGI